VNLLVLDYPLELANTGYHRYAHWPWPIFATLEATMLRRETLAERFVYTPRDHSPDRPRDGTDGTSCASS
jgi:hypothetical protein